MKLKKIFLTAAMSLSLASCTMGGGTPTKNQLFHDIADFLETRSVTIDGIPYIDSASDTAIKHVETNNGADGTIPYLYFVIEDNVLEESLAALKAGEWTVPPEETNLGYECLNKAKTIEIFMKYVEQPSGDLWKNAGTNYYVCAYADTLPHNYDGDNGNGNNDSNKSDKLVDNIIAFLKTRGVTVTSLPYFGDTKLDDVVYYEVEDGATGDYYPCFYVVLEGDVVNAALQAFKTAGWTVPSQPSEYGYECVNATETVEIDILYLDPTDPENEGVGGTNFCVYAYDDLYGEGGDDDWDIDWTEADAAVALAIATNIYGETDAEDNVGWFLFYYVMNTIDGNDLEAAVTVAARYLPDGFILVEAVEVETETDDETGESYDIAYGSYANTDGIVVEIDASLSEEEGKINVMYLIYLEGEDVFDDEPGDEEGDANVVQNEDGSYTATVDFSDFSNGSTYSGQKIGDLTIGVVMDTNTQNRPTYYTSGDSLRIYWGTGLSFSVSEGHELVKVEFTCTTGNDKTVDIDDSNLAVTGGTYSVNEKDVTITANQGANELKMILNLTKGNVAITGISVTYK